MLRDERVCVLHACMCTVCMCIVCVCVCVRALMHASTVAEYARNGLHSAHRQAGNHSVSEQLIYVALASRPASTIHEFMKSGAHLLLSPCLSLDLDLLRAIPVPGLLPVPGCSLQTKLLSLPEKYPYPYVASPQRSAALFKCITLVKCSLLAGAAGRVDSSGIQEGRERLKRCRDFNTQLKVGTAFDAEELLSL